MRGSASGAVGEFAYYGMERHSYYIVSAEPVWRYIGCHADAPKVPPNSNWFITDKAAEAYDVGDWMEALEVCNELNGKPVEAVYNLVDPEGRTWKIVNAI